MSKITYHGALAPINEACEIGGYLCVSHLMANPQNRTGFLRQSRIAWRHLGLIVHILRYRSKKLILVRDFSNVPLMVVFPLVRWKRRELFFLVNHNLQWTLNSRLERVAFRRLLQWGGQFVFLETIPEDALLKLGMDCCNCYKIFHPVPDNLIRRNRAGGVKSIGLIGQYRPEKGMDEMLEVLKPLSGHYRVIIALPNPSEFRTHAQYAADNWFEVVDTSDINEYRNAIAECDVVVLNHPVEHYSCRASGLIADAASAHVPVIVRNLPLLRHQVYKPVRIGVCFDDIDQVPACIENISSDLLRGAFDFMAYRTARSGIALTDQVKKLLAAE